jgi:hypothetical protein
MQWMDLLVAYSRIGTATSFHCGLIRTGVGEFCGMYWSDVGSYVRVQCGKVRFVEIMWGWLCETVFGG